MKTKPAKGLEREVLVKPGPFIDQLNASRKI